MKAVIYEKYGSPDRLHLAEVARPIPTDDQVLIKIHAVSINGSDREGLIGRPLYARFNGLLRPGNKVLGSDIAGRVELAGKNITGFRAGDEVFGELLGYHGGFAEYVCTSGSTLALKPNSLTFEQAAAIPQAGVIALQGIREQGRVQAGQSVLINGAGGSGGSFAIQLARLFGAEVTGVDHGSKLDFMRSLGADHVVDYTKEDFTRSGRTYDLILDLIAYRSVFASQRALRPQGTCFVVGGATGVLLQVLLFGPLIRRRTMKNMRILMVTQNRKDLLAVTELCETGAIAPSIDRIYPLEEVPAAMRYMLAEGARGKVVIRVSKDTGT